jgi:uncharacterized protein (DUF427 family)
MGSPEHSYEPTGRRIRVRFGGRQIADTTSAILLMGGYRPPKYELSNYAFPAADVVPGILSESQRREDDPRGETRYYDVTVGERTLPNGAWTFSPPSAAFADLQDHVVFDWNAMDSWWEEDEQVYVHPRAPYHRVDALRSSRRVRISRDGVELASTDRPVLLFETGMPTRYYIPRLDVRMELLSPSETHTQCPYKGIADYYSATLSGEVLADIAWTYTIPVPECPRIEQLVCFFAEHLDVEVDGELLPSPTTKWTTGIPDRDLV